MTTHTHTHTPTSCFLMNSVSETIGSPHSLFILSLCYTLLHRGGVFLHSLRLYEEKRVETLEGCIIGVWPILPWGVFPLSFIYLTCRLKDMQHCDGPCMVA
ncbi:hypothetical protein CC80DRAFT_90873 [Byssothecium circinans]|uniref:Uncharacterized protein n=1 Tax=Byssothecium circinans TaxID=147558 RepID=A0A6A5TX19_9PLEO|nr:hypothetical protein CC80DRAFT_90873 [Byssothecium circinans]